MQPNYPIADPNDERLNDFRDLSTADKRPDTTRGVVLAEGVPVVERMLASRFAPHAIMGTAPKLDRLAGQAPAVPRYAVTADLMAEVVGFHLNRGVLAAAERPAPLDPARLLDEARIVVVLEGVNDHENLGSIFRNCAALGADAVLFGPRCSDPLYRRAVRVSMGHVLLVPFAHLPAAGWPGDGLALLAERGFRTVALTPSGESTVAQALAGRPERVALVVGAEGPGLSAEMLAAADVRAAIPMHRGTDSLNVATATAVALYECMSQ
ncbi:tRNA/rRNA methyltransferase (SpoU) OS=Tsukamurella paurometabola (strain ATCC 8368 / DSM / CCUG 35730 / CIP 100753 / JCM 10117 / KCTC 9821 / NBRC 16120/ NCIMB 702349 / NCTC 13040) OX=521096 GN=Tpau_0835 PE=4 SV=1 [Tsukamurella paurometabola]|uniref:tRNA/rRNA methyltransferase (SpoU) n=1 Tax=Tsukamurella paurometabola (strain ATCC 8368 / DSM 20162 / CCUG 35730 / CIP 100753 / JCM 10117 / KCTC 9821 / NBRC 16120 / NCIMB 702349 / NCTC 13040) TaxID=521096 RepID=D5UTW7_TSUPD|nr:tRNA/rRNA methyltransferase (SpoU) [Tsukamurella paurometabola DSM 20162]SUP27272.1 rRNA (adenosine-2'-O-)-methyltransferase [Tsukamurella paurometabola]